MNVPSLDIGEALNLFKSETQGLNPPYRGQRLGQHRFIRSIHNSFARYSIPKPKLQSLKANLKIKENGYAEC